MSVRKLSTASILSPSYKNSKFWDGETFPGYYESIQTVVVTSAGAASVVFNNIPQNYAHLQIRCTTRMALPSAGMASMLIQFNSDTGSNYAWHRMWGNSDSPFTGSGFSQTSILFGVSAANGNISNAFNPTVTDILDYSNTSKNTVVRSLTGGDNNYTGSTNGYIALHSGTWLNNNAVTSITITAGAYDFMQYSSIALYGIRSA